MGKVLDLSPGERIGYIIEGNQVRLVNASALEHADPVIDQFLAFLEQLEKLITTAAGESSGAGGEQGPATKHLGHVLDLVFERIPQAPGSSAYRHGGTLGGEHKQWFRAKTGNGRFRLFFRFHSVHKIIVYAWLNDEQSLRIRPRSAAPLARRSEITHRPV